jgi:hypothetical protein
VRGVWHKSEKRTGARVSRPRVWEGVPLVRRMCGQNVRAPAILKINRPEFPTGGKFAGVSPDFGRQTARLQFGGQPRGEITQWEEVPA